MNGPYRMHPSTDEACEAKLLLAYGTARALAVPGTIAPAGTFAEGGFFLTTHNKTGDLNMKMKSRVLEIASVGVFLAFASTQALAQAQPGSAPAVPGVQSNPGSAPAPNTAPTGNAEKQREAADAFAGPWTPDNVTAERPFGTIDTAAAGATSQSVQAWVQSRSEAEREELSGRCAIIADPMHASRYNAEAKQFCTNYMTAANVPTKDNPSGVPGAVSSGQSGAQQPSAPAATP